MTVDEMLSIVMGRTHQAQRRCLEELTNAQQWAFNRLYDTENGADILSTIDEEITLVAASNEIDLAARLSGAIEGVKQLWLKLPTDSEFTLMKPVDLTDSTFRGRDNGDSLTTPAHPVRYFVNNFSLVRFDCLLPIGATVRVDYFRMPIALTADATCALPDAVHPAMVDYATAEIYDALDDDRSRLRYQLAKDKLNDALYLVRDRVKGPTTTQPFRANRRRWV